MTPDKQQFIDNYRANPERYAGSPYLSDPEVVNALVNPPERKLLTTPLGNDVIKHVKNYARLGATPSEVARYLGTTAATFKRWLNEYPQLAEAYETASAECNEQVRRALYHRAVGYEIESVHVANYKGEVTVTPITKHIPADVKAAQYWLNNRMPDEWQDRRSVDHLVEHITPEERIRRIMEMERKVKTVTGPVTIDQNEC